MSGVIVFPTVNSITFQPWGASTLNSSSLSVKDLTILYSGFKTPFKSSTLHQVSPPLKVSI